MADVNEEECAVAERVANAVCTVLPDTTSLKWEKIYGVRFGGEVEVRIVNDIFRGGYAGFRTPLPKDASEEQIMEAEDAILRQVREDLSGH